MRIPKRLFKWIGLCCELVDMLGYVGKQENRRTAQSSVFRFISVPKGSYCAHSEFKSSISYGLEQEAFEYAGDGVECVSSRCDNNLCQ
jgi:hypothetical protein